MAVGILLVTHPGVGTALVAVATRLLRQLPLKTEAFEVAFDADLDLTLPQASAALRRVDGGDGVLVLTDLYGASPSNLAAKLARLGTPVRRVASLNAFIEQELARLESLQPEVEGRSTTLPTLNALFRRVLDESGD